MSDALPPEVLRVTQLARVVSIWGFSEPVWAHVITNPQAVTLCSRTEPGPGDQQPLQLPSGQEANIVPGIQQPSNGLQPEDR
jgi:hypothetical protein